MSSTFTGFTTMAERGPVTGASLPEADHNGMSGFAPVRPRAEADLCRHALKRIGTVKP